MRLYERRGGTNASRRSSVPGYTGTMASAADQMAQSISLAKFAQATYLKKRLWFTIGALIVFRLLSYVPLPGVDPTALGLLSQQTQGGVLDFFNTFSGGSLSRMS